MQAHDSIRYYDHHAQRLHSNWLKEKSSIDLAPFLDELKPNSRVLDLGSGTGMDLNWISKASHEAIGVEGSQAMIEIAREMNPQIEVLHKNLLFLTLMESEFDGIWVNQSFQHFPSEQVQRLVAVCFRGLKKGGVLGVVLQEGSGSFEDREGDLNGPSRAVYLYSEKVISSMIEQTGFQIKKIGRKTTSHGPQILILANRI